MNNEQLSQNEIDALMKGDKSDDSSASAANTSSENQMPRGAALMGEDTPDSIAAKMKNGGQMSQAEIDALMGVDSYSGGEKIIPQAAMNDLMAPIDDYIDINLPQITDTEKDAMGEIGNISMGTAATTLAILLGRRVSITTPKVSVTTLTEMRRKYPLPCLVVEVGYKTGIAGTNLMTVQEKDALIIANLMMGGNGLNPPSELNEIYLSAIAEAMNQMMGSTATSMSTIFRKKVDIAPPKVSVVDFGSDNSITEAITDDDPVVRVSFRMEVEDLIDSDLTQILPYSVAQEMVENLMQAMTKKEEAQAAAAPPRPQAAAAPPRPQAAAATPRPQAAAVPPRPQVAAAPPADYQHSNSQQPSYLSHSGDGVPVQPAQFQPLTSTGVNMEDSNIGLIMDVPLQVTVELGRTRKLIREILELNPGSVVELDKLAGEPVDVLVNGKLIARGEVVVIDENFGVRITYICNKAERISTLQ